MAIFVGAFMFGKVGARWALAIASAIALGSASAAHANSVSIVGSPLTVNADSSTGSSFKFDGTITPSTTMTFTVTGQAFLQASSEYGTNAAGVITTAGKDAGESVGTATDVPGTRIPYGALEIVINGFGPVVFRATPANGLGSSNPTQTLTFTGALSKLFYNFTPVTNPTFTFVVADGATTYFDNSGGFTITQGVDPAELPAVVQSIPVPAAAWQSLIGLAGVGMIVARKRLAAPALAKI
jgi:hypothetical protein